MDAEKIGLSAAELGAGRKTKTDTIDFSAGIVLAAKTGDKVKQGGLIATLYTSKETTLNTAEELFHASYELGEKEPKGEALIYKFIRE